MGKVRTTLTIDEAVLRAVRIRAERSGREEGEVVEDAVKRGLGLDVFERMERNDLSEEEAARLGVEAQHRTRLAYS